MHDAVLLPAGIAAGICNGVAGGGSLVTFPVFLSLGYSPYVANVTNTVGVFASNIGAVYGYRDEIRRHASMTAALASAGVLGSVIGAVLLLAGGGDVFAAIVPFLILAGALSVLLQPQLVRMLAKKSGAAHVHLRLTPVATVVIAVYGGYFGAAMGVMLLGVFGALLRWPLQTLNGMKNAVALCINTTCAAIFAVTAPVQWTAAGWMTIGTLVGGALGASLARRLPDSWFRAFVVVVGVSAAGMIALT